MTQDELDELSAALEQHAELSEAIFAKACGNTVALQAITAALKQVSPDIQRSLVSELDEALDDPEIAHHPDSRMVLANLREIAESRSELTPEQRRAAFRVLSFERDDSGAPDEPK